MAVGKLCAVKKATTHSSHEKVMDHVKMPRVRVMGLPLYEKVFCIDGEGEWVQ